MRTLTLLMFVAASLSGDDFKLPAGCMAPGLGAIATLPDTFASCGNVGSESNGTPATGAKALEDTAKNNFCADATKPVTIDFKTLRAMQAPAEAKKAALATSRKPIEGFFSFKGGIIGEGTVVRLMALIKDAHISDCRAKSTTKGEAVNCHQLGIDHNDFHVPLMDPGKPQDHDECNSVTAEISPHFRPEAWKTIDLQTPTENAVRITGPLFFDDSHDVCAIDPKTGKMAGSPARSSLWEIHPVYSIEVCVNDTAAKCKVASSDPKMWVPYHIWVGNHLDRTTASGKLQRDSCNLAVSEGGGPGAAEK
jgi:hypothetical protein